MLAALAFKFNWRRQRKEKGLSYDKPNIIMGANAQVALEKFAVYFDVEARLVPVTKESHFVMPVEEAVKLVDENTIGVVAILGSTFTGRFENVEELNTALEKLQAEKGWNVPIHVDGASGGFVAPFLFPDLKWDFRLPHVKSINASGHKFGLVYPGVGWCIWRSKEDVPEDLIFHINYLGGNFPSFTLNFSKGSGQVIAQYYNFLRLGRIGYQGIINNCASNALLLDKCLRASKYFLVHSDLTTGVPLVAFSILDEVAKTVDFTEYDISHKIRQRGWIVPAYNLPKNCENINVLRIVVREGHSEDLIENLIKDLLWAFETLRDEPRAKPHPIEETSASDTGSERSEKSDKSAGIWSNNRRHGHSTKHRHKNVKHTC